jgi:hypothetical protein
VIDRCPLRATGRHLLAQEDQHVREHHDLVRAGADLHGCTAERVDPELLVRVDAGDIQVVMSVYNWSVFRRQ